MDNNLLYTDEELVVDLKAHWLFLSGAMILLGLSIIATFVAIEFKIANLSSSGYQLFLAIFLLAILAFSLLQMIFKYIQWSMTHFILTTNRLIIKTGLITTNIQDVSLDRLINIEVKKSLIQRIFGAGNLTVDAGLDGSQINFYYLANPAKIQRLIWSQVSLLKASHGQENNTSSIPQQILLLHELLLKGAISQTEFETKKAQLLERM